MASELARLMCITLRLKIMPAIADPTITEVMVFPPEVFGDSDRAYNGSLIDFDGRFLMAYRHHFDNDWRSEIRIAELGSGMEIIRISKVSNTGLTRQNSEDPRLFSHCGKLWLAWTTAEMLDNSWYADQHYGELEMEDGGFTIVEVFTPNVGGNRGKRVEKNWQFFSSSDRLFVQYCLRPHVVYELQGNEAIDMWKTEGVRWREGMPSGGAPPIPFRPGEMISMFHAHVSDNEAGRRYNMGLMIFEDHPPFAVKRHSRVPLLYGSSVFPFPEGWWKPHVVFPQGMVRTAENSFLISLGINDCRIGLVEIWPEDFKLMTAEVDIGWFRISGEGSNEIRGRVHEHFMFGTPCNLAVAKFGERYVGVFQTDILGRTIGSCEFDSNFNLILGSERMMHLSDNADPRLIPTAWAGEDECFLMVTNYWWDKENSSSQIEVRHMTISNAFEERSAEFRINRVDKFDRISNQDGGGIKGEKHWLPFATVLSQTSESPEMHCLFVQSIRPHRVMKYSFSQKALSLAGCIVWNLPDGFRHLGNSLVKGGAAPILTQIKGEMVWLATWRIDERKGGSDWGFYTFSIDPPYTPISIGRCPVPVASWKPLVRDNEGIRHIKIASIVDRDDHLVLTGGINSNRCVVIEIPRSLVEASLIDIDQNEAGSIDRWKIQLGEGISGISARESVDPDSMPAGIPLFIWRDRSGSNFGDELGRLIVERFTKRSVKILTPSDKWDTQKLLGIGSTLDAWATNGDVVWGAGTHGIVKAKDLDIRAVRGPLTKGILRARGLNPPEAMGDPAILASRLFPFDYNPDGRIGLFPHIGDDPWDVDGFYISPNDPPLKIISDMMKCERIYTSSLHGLIVAETYCVPVCLVSGREFREKPMKFIDYFWSTGRQLPEVFLLQEMDRHHLLKDPTFPDRDLLAAAFPVELFES